MASDLIDRLHDIHGCLGKLQATLDNQTRDIQELKEVVILGNRERSLVSRMVSVEEKVSILLEEGNKKTESGRHWVGAVIALVAAVASWVALLAS